MNTRKSERDDQRAQGKDKYVSNTGHALSASDESTIARWLCRATYLTFVMPNTLSSFPAGTTIGPAWAALPGAGWGKAVEVAVWKAIIPFHLLHRLMNVSIQHRDRTEPLQIRERLRTILRPPAPLRVHHPQRNMREDHNRRRRGKRRQIVLQPAQLLRPQLAHRIDLQHVVQPDEVHALVLKAVPAIANRALAEPFR